MPEGQAGVNHVESCIEPAPKEQVSLFTVELRETLWRQFHQNIGIFYCRFVWLLQQLHEQCNVPDGGGGLAGLTIFFNRPKDLVMTPLLTNRCLCRGGVDEVLL